MVERWLTLASAETDEHVRADLKASALVLAEAAGREDLWHPKLKEWNVIRSRTIDSWKAEEAAKLLVALLEAKFKSLPEEVSATINSTTDLDTLERWVPLAGLALSLEQFRKDAKL
jgi:hypothetical protein